MTTIYDDIRSRTAEITALATEAEGKDAAQQATIDDLSEALTASNYAIAQQAATITSLETDLVSCQTALDACLEGTSAPEPEPVFDQETAAPGATPPRPAVVSPPSSGVALIQPGDSWQQKASDHPEGTVFRMVGGLHDRTALDFRPRLRQEFYGDVDASGKPLVIVRGGWAVGKQFFNALASGANGVKLHNVIAEHYFLPALQDGIVRLAAGTESVTGCEVMNVEVRDSIGSAVAPGQGNVCRLINAHGVYKSFAGRGSSILEFSHWWDLNNPSDLLQPRYQKMVDEQLGKWDRLVKDSEGRWTVMTGFEAGFKYAKSDGAIIRWNEAGPDINGRAIWFDILNRNYEVYGNHVHDSPFGQVSFEVGYGGRAHHNLFERVGLGELATDVNAWAMMSGESKGSAERPVEFDHNIVRECRGGLGGRQGSGRFDEFMASGDHKRVAHLWVHDNDLEDMPDAFLGGISSEGSHLVCAPEFENRWERNRYRNCGRSKPFKWIGGPYSFADWQRQGQDVDGTWE